jgi:hypothetical protein
MDAQQVHYVVGHSTHRFTNSHNNSNDKICFSNDRVIM